MPPELQIAMTEMFGAERRLRRRDQEAGGVTTAQLLALFALDEVPAVTAGQLARAVDLNPAAITGMMASLIRMGVVERHVSPEDGRAWMISLTDAGKVRVAETRAEWEKAWKKYTCDLTAEETAIGIRVMGVLTRVLDSYHLQRSAD